MKLISLRLLRWVLRYTPINNFTRRQWFLKLKRWAGEL